MYLFNFFQVDPHDVAQLSLTPIAPSTKCNEVYPVKVHTNITDFRIIPVGSFHVENIFTEIIPENMCKETLQSSPAGIICSASFTKKSVYAEHTSQYGGLLVCNNQLVGITVNDFHVKKLKVLIKLFTYLQQYAYWIIVNTQKYDNFQVNKQEVHAEYLPWLQVKTKKKDKKRNQEEVQVEYFARLHVITEMEDKKRKEKHAILEEVNYIEDRNYVFQNSKQDNGWNVSSVELDDLIEPIHNYFVCYLLLTIALVAIIIYTYFRRFFSLRFVSKLFKVLKT